MPLSSCLPLADTTTVPGYKLHGYPQLRPGDGQEAHLGGRRPVSEQDRGKVEREGSSHPSMTAAVTSRSAGCSSFLPPFSGHCCGDRPCPILRLPRAWSRQPSLPPCLGTSSTSRSAAVTCSGTQRDLESAPACTIWPIIRGHRLIEPSRLRAPSIADLEGADMNLLFGVSCVGSAC